MDFASFFSSRLLWLALAHSLYFGLFIQKIFGFKAKNWHEFAHQAFFNAAGIFVGWVVMYSFFLMNVWQLNVGHVLLLLVGFAGITGQLPYIVRFGSWIKIK